jgi:hypothetical protein
MPVVSRKRLALCCGLLAALLLTVLLFPFRPEEEFDPPGGGLADFVAHLQQRGVRLRVIWGKKVGDLGEHVYLTEDPEATWASLQGKPRLVARIHQWHGTAWVGRLPPGMDEEDDIVAQEGPYGCRVGPFVLFGDDRILRQIQEACRQQIGR